uniref:AKNA domain containing 1 n=1 Tax=Chrysemys picta bellii TaxID=8478 RepID=A0A8C3IZT2_CHRPI|nr:protein AKNAD1 isoform X1 [Chrysemys picta bellii]XP_042696593.1 protein AKNAD1 isoform X1 [Chrysemys picta bellii]
MEYNQDIQIRTSKNRQHHHLKKQVNNILLDNFDYPEDATDEEQEDLPYDGDLERTYHHNNESNNLKACVSVENISDNFLNLTCSEINRSLKEEINYETQQLSQEKVFSHRTPATRTNGIMIEMAIEAPLSGMPLETELSVGAFSSLDRKEHFTNSKISDVLLRHFSKEELSNTSQLIDCETIPETSFTESVDETVLTKTRISECTKRTLLTEQWTEHFEDYNLNRQEEISEDDYKDKNLLDENKFVIDNSATSYGDEKDCIQENSQLIAENEDTNNFQNIRKNHSHQKGLFERTGSSHELKYGQGQVNYCLPDFSKVAPKVKIPKRNNSDKSAPIIKRTKFSPNLVGKSAIVNNVLETMNYFDSVEVKNQEEEMRIPELLQQLELLTKHAEAQNRIDHLRFDPKIYTHSASPNPNLSIHSRCMGAASEESIFHPLTLPIQPLLGLSQASFSGLQSGRMISSLPSANSAGKVHCLNPNLMQNTTKGEKMSQMLKEQAEQLKAKVEEFSKCIMQEAFPLQDRCLVLKELKGYLDTLERKYLATKEEHRGLQLQHYNHKSISVGEFDPDRKVEGEIFRLGMLLEDVKEKIDDNICSPCPSSFTSPTSPSLTPCESVCSSCSHLRESPVVSSISDPPERSATEVNFHNNERNEGENRSHAIDVIPKKTSQLSLQDDNCDLFPKLQLGLQKRDASAYVKGMEPLEKAELLANKHSSDVMQCFLAPVADNGPGGLESQRQLILSQKRNTNQENPKGSLNFWQMKSPPKTKSYNMCNLEHKIINLNVQQEQGNLAHPSDHCFCERVENCSNAHEAALYPKWKIHWSKNANKELCSCSVNRNKKTEDRKTDSEKSKCGRYSVFIQEKAVELDLSGTNLCSDSEDISFCDSFHESHSDEFLEHKTKNYKSRRAGLKEQSKALQYRDWNINFCTSCQRNKCSRESDKNNIASSQKKRIAANSVCTSKQPDQFVYRLSDKDNLETPKTCYSRMYDTIILSPQYLASRKVYGSKSMVNIRNRHTSYTDTKILNSTLDHAIQTATTLKETTERMVQVVAEDLAKVKTHRNKQFFS